MENAVREAAVRYERVECSEIPSTSQAGMSLALDTRLDSTDSSDGHPLRNERGWNHYSVCRNCGSMSRGEDPGKSPTS